MCKYAINNDVELMFQMRNQVPPFGSWLSCSINVDILKLFSNFHVSSWDNQLLFGPW